MKSSRESKKSVQIISKDEFAKDLAKILKKDYGINNLDRNKLKESVENIEALLQRCL